MNISRVWLPGTATLIGVDDPTPMIAWQLTSATAGDRQTAVEIQLGTTVGGSDLIATGKMPTAEQSFEIRGIPLASATRYYLRVRVWDAANVATAYTAIVIETGLWSLADWSGAKWIGLPGTPAPQLRKEFTPTAGKTIESARLYLAAGGYAEARINGTVVTDPLSPGFTKYDSRVQYVIHDVTARLTAGVAVAVGITLGRGFYGCQTVTDWGWNAATWWGDPRALAKLLVRYSDGTTSTVVSDATWKTIAGPTTADSAYLGETYDARLETLGWDAAGFTDTAWAAATVMTAPKGALVAQNQPPIKGGTLIGPTSLTEVQPGRWRATFPKGMAGWVKIAFPTMTAGTSVTVTYAEKLNGDGTLYTTNTAVTGQGQEDTFISNGSAQDWEPRFSYKGFRYVDIVGVQPTNVFAREVMTNYQVTGSWTSSSALLNQLAGMAVQSLRINSHGIITDTPMFERNGWLGDANVMTWSVIYALDVHALLKKWLTDMADHFATSGKVPVIVPWSGTFLSVTSSPCWTSLFILGAHKLYTATGDLTLIAQHFERMRGYVDSWLTDPAQTSWPDAFSDWGSPAGNNQDGAAAFMGTLSVVLQTRALADMAEWVGRPSLAGGYRDRCDTIVAALNTLLSDPGTGVYKPNPAWSGEFRPSATVLAARHGLIPSGLRASAVAAVEQDARVTRGNHIGTGIFGEEHLLGVLTEAGYVDTALAIAQQTTTPSWGEWANLGATTCWNSWGGLTGQRSLSHHMHGSYLAWLYQYLAGITLTGPASVTIKPYFPTGLTSVSASVETMRGSVTVAWDATTFTVTVPPGLTALYQGAALPSGTNSLAR